MLLDNTFAPSFREWSLPPLLSRDSDPTLETDVLNAQRIDASDLIDRICGVFLYFFPHSFLPRHPSVKGSVVMPDSLTETVLPSLYSLLDTIASGRPRLHVTKEGSFLVFLTEAPIRNDEEEAETVAAWEKARTLPKAPFDEYDVRLFLSEKTARVVLSFRLFRDDEVERIYSPFPADGE